LSDSDRNRWDARYAAKPLPSSLSPDAWLCEQANRLRVGQALDLACGLGHNAIWLGLNGWQVDAVDISPVGLELAAQLATQSKCHSVTWIAADLDTFNPAPDSFDLLTVFRFLDRERLPSLIVRALKPGGTLLYETFTETQLTRTDNHLKSTRFTLAPGELPSLFPSLNVADFQELDLQDRSVARLVATKPLRG
jgi:SAM-dependent methyltransferase